MKRLQFKKDFEFKDMVFYKDTYAEWDDVRGKYTYPSKDNVKVVLPKSFTQYLIDDEYLKEESDES